MREKKYFGTDGIRGRVGESLINPEFVLKLGWAVGKALGNGGNSKVLIGKDTRISGYLLESALEAGLSAAGVNICLLGPMPTPGIAYLTRTLRACAGIVISASHNPYYDNGIKFFDAEGQKLPDEVELEIEHYLDQALEMTEPKLLGRASRVTDAPGRYIEFCKGTIPPKFRLNTMKIVLDCANGATYHIAPSVFTELGADVIALGVGPDGLNINAGSGSTNPENLQRRVLEEQADVGIALDGDGDRLIMVDNRGEIVDGDELLFIMAQDRMTKSHLHGGVVGTVMTNYGIEQGFAALNIPFVRTSVGDRHVLAELLNRKWNLGGESSGHIVCLDKTSTGDGIISALQVLHAMLRQDKSLHELRQGIKKVPQVLFNIPTHDQTLIMQNADVQQALQFCEQTLSGSGRVLLRPSGTEPLIRVMVEGQDNKQIEKIASELAAVINKIEGQGNS